MRTSDRPSSLKLFVHHGKFPVRICKLATSFTVKAADKRQQERNEAKPCFGK